MLARAVSFLSCSSSGAHYSPASTQWRRRLAIATRPEQASKKASPHAPSRRPMASQRLDDDASDRQEMSHALSDTRARCCTATRSRHVRSQNTICSIDIAVGARAISCRLRSGSRTPRRGLVLHRRLIVATSAQCAGLSDSRARPGPSEHLESFVRERRRPKPACPAWVSPVPRLSEGADSPPAPPRTMVSRSSSPFLAVVRHG